MEKFGERLREARRDKGLSQKELADKVGVTNSRIGHYENERGTPTAETLVELCKVLDVSSDWLLGIPDKTQESKKNEAI